MSIIDLHMHSKHSLDGEYSSKQMINLCQKSGLKIISITDHNSIEAIDEAKYYAKKSDIKLIPGIEIDCSHKDINIHLLGYNIDYKASVFSDLTKSHYKQEVGVSRERVRKINELGFNVSIDDLLEINDTDAISPEDIAEYLLNSPYAVDNEILMPYLPGGPRSDNPYVNFYWDYFSTGKPCYCHIQTPSIEKAIQMVVTNGGTPVLAHPGITLKNNYLLINELISLGIQGIEAFSSYHNTNECKLFYNIAKENKMIITSGSDFHGKTKPSVKLGKTNCFLDDKILLAMIKAYKQSFISSN